MILGPCLGEKVTNTRRDVQKPTLLALDIVARKLAVPFGVLVRQQIDTSDILCGVQNKTIYFYPST